MKNRYVIVISLLFLSNFSYSSEDITIYHAKEIVNKGGLAPNGFNYANDKLVNLFLDKKIRFSDIINFNIATMDKYFGMNSNIEKPTIDDIFNFNKWIDENIYLGE